MMAPRGLSHGPQTKQTIRPLKDDPLYTLHSPCTPLVRVLSAPHTPAPARAASRCAGARGGKRRAGRARRRVTARAARSAAGESGARPSGYASVTRTDCCHKRRHLLCATPSSVSHWSRITTPGLPPKLLTAEPEEAHGQCGLRSACGLTDRRDRHEVDSESNLKSASRSD